MNQETVTAIRNIMLLLVFFMSLSLAVALRPRTGNGLLRAFWLFFAIDALFYSYAVLVTVMGLVLVPAPYASLVVVTGLLLSHGVMFWAVLIRGVKQVGSAHAS